ncbi:DDE-type integrase/transposase/recombinase [Streptomyces yangpuensis]
MRRHHLHPHRRGLAPPRHRDRHRIPPRDRLSHLRPPGDSLAADALKAACHRRQPQGPVVFHSDRGSQYTSQAFTALAAARNIRLSVGRTGVCWDPEAREFLAQRVEVRFGRQDRHHTIGRCIPLPCQCRPLPYFRRWHRPRAGQRSALRCGRRPDSLAVARYGSCLAVDEEGRPMRLWTPHLAVRRTWTVELRPQPHGPQLACPHLRSGDSTRAWCDSPLGRAGSPGRACQARCSAAASADLPVSRTGLPLAPPPPRLRRPGRPCLGPRTRRAPVAAGRRLHQLRRCNPRCRCRPRDTGRHPARTEQAAPLPRASGSRPPRADSRHALVPRGCPTPVHPARRPACSPCSAHCARTGTGACACPTVSCAACSWPTRRPGRGRNWWRPAGYSTHGALREATRHSCWTRRSSPRRQGGLCAHRRPVWPCVRPTPPRPARSRPQCG